MNQLLIAIILTVLPITELRIGMPLAINYAINNSIPIIAIAILIILINILTIFAIYFFLEYIHKKLEKIKIYRRGFELWMSRIRKKVDKIEKKEGWAAFLALYLFVAVPLPGTGAWTGTIIAWFLGLKKKYSLIAISLGVITAGIIIALATMGIFKIKGII
ncbi:ligand-binding protein SH3 [Candidatus Pacearchaeota archaeon CG10_big_fil_rev_8_21_14_0_10_35_13]|nr:MAG: ligand-binding protein SH3 [Candidatus Pacearchaeota archaeon CG10_big_fil_rev_8_21_14_0_10_35_13]